MQLHEVITQLQQTYNPSDEVTGGYLQVDNQVTFFSRTLDERQIQARIENAIGIPDCMGCRSNYIRDPRDPCTCMYRCSNPNCGNRKV